MSRLGLAAALARLNNTGVAGAAASILLTPVLQEDEGTNLLEWVLRSVVAILRVALGWPKGERLTILEILQKVFGDSLAGWADQALKSITNLVALFDFLAFILKWAQVALAIGMFVGIASYMWVYNNQSSKSVKMLSKIWGGRTLILNPFEWFVRVFLVSCVLAIFMTMLRSIVVDGYAFALWLSDFVYSGAGTTSGQAFETMMFNLADSSIFGFVTAVVILMVLFFFAVKLLIKFLKRLVRFVVSIFISAWELGRSLDGSKLRKVWTPVQIFLESFLLVVLTVLFLYLAPLVAFKFPNVVGAFLLVVALDFAADFPRLIDKWFGKYIRPLQLSLQAAGNWIDQDIDEYNAQHPEEVDYEHYLQHIDGWKPKMPKEKKKKRPTLAHRAASVGMEAVRMDPRFDSQLAAAAGIASTLTNQDQLTKAVRESMSSTASNVTGGRSANVSLDPRQDRESAMAQYVAGNEQLLSLLKDLKSDESYAEFFEIARKKQSSLERIDVIQRDVRADIKKSPKENLAELAEKGRKVAREVRRRKGKRPSAHDVS